MIYEVTQIYVSIFWVRCASMQSNVFCAQNYVCKFSLYPHCETLHLVVGVYLGPRAN